MQELDYWFLDTDVHAFVKLAYASILCFVQLRQRIRINQVPPQLEHVLRPFSKELGTPSACFVSLKKAGMLRGCIGTIEPATSSLAEEIAENAVSAASRDPRFPPVKDAELRDITVSVDVLTPPQPATYKELDPKKLGVIVKQGYRRGLLLPDLPEVTTADTQLRIAAQKGGIDLDRPHDLYVFTVDRYF